MRTPDVKARDNVSAVLFSMVASIPGIVINLKLNSASVTIKEKVFAFTKGDGVVLKLPPRTVKRLVEGRAASMLVMGKRTMKEWVVIRLKNPADAKKHLELLREAMAFVSAKTKGRES